MPVRIVTDSACDLTRDETERHHIEVVPLTIRFGATEYVDREQLSVSDFYQKLASSPDLPETAAPAPGAFQKAFDKAADEGATEVVCINLSSQLSATMQSARTAAGAFNRIPVQVVDSNSITAGLGTLVMHAAELAATGASADAIVHAIEGDKRRLRVYGSLDTLENLKKGGRIGGAAALLGGMLSIKPLLDLSSGSVAEAGKTRTRKKAMLWLRDKVRSSQPVEKLNVMHGEAPDIQEFLDLLREDFDLATVRVGPIGAVIGSHGGPRVLGVTYLVQ